MITIRQKDFLAIVDDDNKITSNDKSLEVFIETALSLNIAPSYQGSQHAQAAAHLKQIFDDVTLTEEYDELAVY